MHKQASNEFYLKQRCAVHHKSITSSVRGEVTCYDFLLSKLCLKRNIAKMFVCCFRLFLVLLKISKKNVFEYRQY